MKIQDADTEELQWAECKVLRRLKVGAKDGTRGPNWRSTVSSRVTGGRSELIDKKRGNSLVVSHAGKACTEAHGSAIGTFA